MLHALLHGKIARWLTRDPWEIEDLLTAVVFGNCGYAGIEGWSSALRPFLAQASDSPVPEGAKRLGDILPRRQEVGEIFSEFWPKFAGFAQQPYPDGSTPAPTSYSIAVAPAIPELTICLKTRGEQKWFVLVEVKLNAGESSGPASSPQEIADQLAKYWHHLKRHACEQGEKRWRRST
jgi:hypothetical protein